MTYIKQVVAEQEEQAPPSPDSLFEDVYAELPWHLQDQQAELSEAIRRGDTP